MKDFFSKILILPDSYSYAIKYFLSNKKLFDIRNFLYEINQFGKLWGQQVKKGCLLNYPVDRCASRRRPEYVFLMNRPEIVQNENSFDVQRGYPDDVILKHA